MIAAFQGEDRAQHIAQRAGWDVGQSAPEEKPEPKGTDPNFTKADFESALRKVSRKLPR